MDASEGWVEIAAGVKKYVHRWCATDTPLADVLIVHGLGEHGGRYRRLGVDFATAGLNVVAFDQQGHGRSPEPRGCIRSYTSLLDDIEQMVGWINRHAGTRKLILFGHSMGGNLAINHVLRNRPGVDAVIASSPMLRAVREPSWLIERLLRCVRLFAPNLTIQSHVVAAKLMDDPDEIDAFVRDELFHSKISLGLAAGLVDSGRWALRHAAKLRHPMLLTHGTADLLTRHDASELFARRAGPCCHLVLLPGILHDPFRCRIRDQVVRQYVEFMQQTVASGAVT